MFHAVCRAALKIGLSCLHEEYLRNKNDKEPADERSMMESHRCFGNGGASAGRVTCYL